MITEKGRLAQVRRNWTSRFRGRRKDAYNRREFGVDAPRYAEMLWVRTDEVEAGLKKWSSKCSAEMIVHWPSELVRPLHEWTTIRCCLQHWKEGMSWEQTGLIDQMMSLIHEKGKVDRLSTRKDVLRRYAQLDALYELVVKEQKLSTRRELVKGNFREEGGILIHIGPDRKPYFGGKGNHRLAIAIAAGLDYFPAQLGVVHISALDSLAGYRADPARSLAPVEAK